MKTSILIPQKHNSGFTLAEVLVSSVLIVVIMGLLLSTVTQTQRVWSKTTSKVAQFQGARTAFEAMTRRLAQATLNTYWRAWDGAGDTQRENFFFTRKADLQFLSGPAEVIFKKPALTDIDGDYAQLFPGHAMFFFGPFGYTEEPPPAANNATLRLVKDDNPMGSSLRFRMTDSLISACGYFVEFGDEEKPGFLSKLDQPKKYRYRLKEMNVPSELITIMRQPTIQQVTGLISSKRITLRQVNEQFILDESENLNASAYYPGLVATDRRILNDFVRPSWMKVALFRETVNFSDAEPVKRFRFARSMADNIIALIILPKLAERDRFRSSGQAAGADPEYIGGLAPEYAYDSWRRVPPSTATDADLAEFDKGKFPPRDCVLPPIVQVTMVAIDESSAAKMDLQPEDLPGWMDGLFKKVEREQDYLRDLAELERRLQEHPIKPAYRVFTNDVVIRSSKWTQNN